MRRQAISLKRLHSCIALEIAAWAILFCALQNLALSAIVDLGANNFSHLSQNDPGLTTTCSANNLNFACGPVAAVNSFSYLQNAYPSIYDNSLIEQGNLVQTAKDLAGPNFMNCMACAGGVSIQNFVNGKQRWIEGSVPGKTAYSLTFAPSIDLLVTDLSTCWGPVIPGVPCGQDVELFVGFYDRTGARVGGHAITLFMASSGADGTMLGFIDPDSNPAANTTKSYTILGGALAGVIQINNYGPANTLSRVEWAIDESPLPEPASVAVVVAGLSLLGYLARRRKLRT